MRTLMVTAAGVVSSVALIVATISVLVRDNPLLGLAAAICAVSALVAIVLG